MLVAAGTAPLPLRRILQAGGDANARDVTGQSALMVSALNVRQAEPKAREDERMGDPPGPQGPPGTL